jgi:zinc/manganese transport system ATP-binding protein
METQHPAILLEGAHLRLGNRDLWKKLDLSVAAGECIAVLGPNGSGKSSLIKAVLGVQPLSKGTVRVRGESPVRARHAIGYVPQQKTFDRGMPLSGYDLVALGLTGTRWFVGRTPAADSARIQDAIAEVGATRYAHKRLGDLSGGEQQRLRIAQAIVADPPVLLCDEPLLSLDPASQQAVTKIIDGRRKKGTAVLFVTHEINPILPIVDRVLYVVGGRWAIGTPAEIMTTERLSALYGAPVEVINVHGRILVVAVNEHVAAEPHDVHHHVVHNSTGVLHE